MYNNFYKNFYGIVIILTWYKMGHKLSHEHNMSNINKHCSIAQCKTQQPGAYNYGNVVIKIVYELWHNYSSCGHNIEQNDNG